MLAEIARLRALEKQVQAECDRELGLVREKFANQFTIVVDGQQVAIKDRCEQLETAVEDFATEHRETILEAGKKSVDINHGRIGWRNGQRKLVACGTPKAFGETLDLLVAALRRTLKRFTLLFAIGDAQFFNVQLTMNKEAMLIAFERDEISAAELKKVGLAVEEAGEKFYLTVKAQDIASQTAQTPAPAASA